MARLGIPVHVVEAFLNHPSGTIRGVVGLSLFAVGVSVLSLVIIFNQTIGV
jgi:hypothetical protein